MTATGRDVGDQLGELSPNAKTKRLTLVMRLRFREAFYTMLGQDDPVLALLETWGLGLRLKDYFEVGEGRSLYGEHTGIALAFATDLEARLEQIGAKFLGESSFEETRENLKSFAARNPIRTRFTSLIVYATEARPGQTMPFADVAAIPMAPLKALEGVDRTASAIYGVQSSMDRFSAIVDDMPESVRWQLLLLLMDMEDTEIVKAMLTSMPQVSDSSARLADTAEQLPKTLREQTSVLIEEIDAKQANLQTTIDKVQETTLALEKAFAAAQKTVESTARTAESIRQTAHEWESAIGATGEFVEVIKQWRAETPKKKETSASVTVNDYKETVQGVTLAADELKSLVAEVREMLDSGVLTAHVRDVNDRVIGVVDRTAIRADGFTDHVFWRSTQFSGIVFVLALVYRFVSTRVVGRRK